MNKKDFSITITTQQPASVVYNAINEVNKWWGSTIEGKTQQVGDEFIYRHKTIHYSKHKIVEMIPDKKVVWEVLDAHLSFVQPADEWTGTYHIFEITEKDGKTRVTFTHEGLTSECKCFEACSGGWTYYIQNSLLPLIETGTGNPDA